MSEDKPFRLSKKLQIFIYCLIGFGASIVIFLVLSPSTTLEQQKALTNFLLAIAALEIGVMLFLLQRRSSVWRNFVEAMTLLILFMAPVGLIVPLLLAFEVSIYLLFPTFLIPLISWLFFTKYVIYGKNNWDKDTTKQKILVPWYLLIAGFFVGGIILVVIAPNIPNWTP